MITPPHPSFVKRAAGAVIAVFVLAAATAPAGADDFEHPDRVATGSVVPSVFLRSTHYDIAPEARAEDNFYVFHVTSDFGTYDITSLAMLRVRLHEIATLAEVSARLGESDITFDRNPGGRRGVGSERVVDILTDPVGTAAQLLGNIQYNVEQTLAGPDDDNAPLDARGALDLNPGPHKRSAAAQLGVDVYSSNPHLQGLLDTLAEARSAGDMASSISPLVRNVYAPVAFGSGVLDMRLASTVKNSDAQTLNADVERRLAALGIDQRERVTLLAHPAYTPRTRLYLVSYLELLAPLRNLDALVRAANGARTEADAHAYMNYARMLAFYRLAGSELTEVVTEARFPTVADAGGRGVLALPLDYLAWTPNVAKAVATLADIRQRHELAGFVLLLAGQASTRVTDELVARGLELRPTYSF